MNRIITASLVLLLISLPGFAQTATDELRASGNAFRKYENLSMQVSVYTYATANPASASFVGKGKMSKSKEGYYSSFLNDEMISNSSCTVILNHESKTMHCFDGDERKKRKDAFVPQLDSVRPGDSLQYKGIVNGMKLVVIYHKNSYISKSEIYINPSTSLYSRIVYYYAPANEDFTADAFKSEIIYDQVSFDEPDAKLFSTEKFISHKNKTWVSTPAFKNYRLTVVMPPEL